MALSQPIYRQAWRLKHIGAFDDGVRLKGEIEKFFFHVVEPRAMLSMHDVGFKGKVISQQLSEKPAQAQLEGLGGDEPIWELYDEVRGNAEGLGWKRLKADLDQGLLAGLLLISPRQIPEGVSLDGIKCSSIGVGVEGGLFQQMPLVNMDKYAMMKLMSRVLVEQGAKRVAIFSPFLRFLPFIQRELGRVGLCSSPSWIAGLPLQEPRWVRYAVQAIFDRPTAQRPDALYIVDDFFLEDILRGLGDLGLVVGRDCQIVSHGNFPIDRNHGVPIHWVGFDMEELLGHLMTQLHRKDESEGDRVIVLEPKVVPSG